MLVIYLQIRLKNNGKKYNQNTPYIPYGLYGYRENKEKFNIYFTRLNNELGNIENLNNMRGRAGK